VVNDFGFGSQLGYLVADNANNNDSACKLLGEEYGFDGFERRCRCIGHIFNLVVKALLFGKDHEVFEKEVAAGILSENDQHLKWVKRGPVGKLHNLTVVCILFIFTSSELNNRETNPLASFQEIGGSDFYGAIFMEVQASYARAAPADDPLKQHKALEWVLDNDTRWLSQYYMMERALVLEPFYEAFLEESFHQWKKYHARKGTTSPLKGAQHKLPRFLEDENRLTPDDWTVIRLLKKLLEDFEKVMRDLEGDGKLRQHNEKWKAIIQGQLLGYFSNNSTVVSNCFVNRKELGYSERVRVPLCQTRTQPSNVRDAYAGLTTLIQLIRC
jgi:hypothetical protein